MILSYWEVVTFQGPNFVQLREGIGLYIQFPVRVDPPVSPDPFQHLDLHLPKLFWPTARWNATSPVDVSPGGGGGGGQNNRRMGSHDESIRVLLRGGKPSHL